MQINDLDWCIKIDKYLLFLILLFPLLYFNVFLSLSDQFVPLLSGMMI